MKASEAMLLGSMMAPKAIGYRHLPSGAVCALGAIERAYGVTQMWRLAAEEFYPFLKGLARDPVNGYLLSISEIIASLNNGIFCEPWSRKRIASCEPWSRERIASWLATIEPKVDAVLPTEPQAFQTSTEACLSRQVPVEVAALVTA